MNRIPLCKILNCFDLMNEGFSNREISRLSKVHKDNVQKLRDTMFQVCAVKFFCKCGLEATHRGWCSVRYQESEKRQAFIKSWGSKKEKISYEETKNC